MVMKRFISWTSDGSQKADALWFCALFTLGFVPLALIIAFVPSVVYLPTCYVLAAACVGLAIFLFRDKSAYLANKFFASTAAKTGAEPKAAVDSG